jgi:RNA-binding protein
VTLTSKRRAELRAEAHHLQPLVQIGHQGITPALAQSLDDALRTRELVKVQLGKHAELDVRDTAHELAGALQADIVQVIGRTATLYRENPELHRDGGSPRARARE